MAEFFHMGGYAVYVWSAYGIAAAVLALNFAAPIRHKRRILKSLLQARRRQAQLARRQS